MKKTITTIVVIFLALSFFATASHAFYIQKAIIRLPEYYRICSEIFVDGFSQPTIKIMPLGDSITDGYKNDFGSRNVDGYRKPLHDMLVADGYSVDFVGSKYTCEHCDFDADHEGHVGKSASTLKNEVFDMLEVHNPDIVLLHIGTNDIRDEKANNDNTFDRVAIFDDVQAIIDEIERYRDVYEKHVTIVMAGRIINQAPVDPYTSFFNDYLEHAIMGENLILVDMENNAGIDYRLTDEGGDMRDLLHPNSSGYEKMANVWYAAVKEYLSDHVNNWANRNSIISSYFYDVHYGNNKFIAVGQSGAILTSCDGQDWNLQYSGTTNNLYGITNWSDQFIAVGYGGTVVSSADGRNWEPHHLGDYNLLDVAAGDNMLVAVGYGGAILSSSDGETWHVRHSGTREALRGVAYGDDTFIAVGNKGILLRSYDGISWASLDSGTVQYLNDVTYGNGRFVAVGLNATILKSYNSTNGWYQPHYTGTSHHLYGVAYGDGDYVAVGRNGAIVRSHWAEYWTASLPRTTKYLIGVTRGRSTFVTVGGYGTILQSMPVSW